MQIKLIIAAALGLAVNASFNKHAPEMKILFNTWKAVNSKTYTHAEESKRFEIFADNYLNALKHNADHSQTFKKGLTKFSDLSAEEFKAINHGYKAANKTHKKAKDAHVDYELLSLPVSVDWRTKGAVTPVKDQGQCGSCWAFSTTGSLEGLNFITSGTLLSFSEQQLVDCDHTNQDSGCEGGLMDDAMTYTAENGLELESDYPYTAADGTCSFDQSLAHTVNSGHTDVQQSTAALKAAVVTQPVSVAIEADEDVFQQYTSGVITKGCGAQLDHGVLVVGYQIVGAQEAFVVKNSWGSDWGMDGYVYISTNQKANGGKGVCGILSAAVFPTA